MRALGYVRVSSKEQATGDRYSLPAQRERLAEACAARGWQLVDVVCDAESGRRDDRRGYQAMLARLRAGEADAVLVRWLDRFGRRQREILARVWELRDLGIRVEATDEDIEEELILLIKAWMAGEEVRKLAERVRPAMAARAAEGKWSGAMPFGMRYSTSGRPEPDPDPRCRALDLAFELYDPDGTECLSLLGVCRRLNALGYRTPTGRPWTKGNLWPLLVNPILVGDLVAHGSEIADNHEGRVARERFERVGARLRARRRNRVSAAERPAVLAAGLLYCECGSRLLHTFTRPRGQKLYGMWGCPRHWGHLGCDGLGISDLALERELRRHLDGSALRAASPGEVVARAERELRRRLGAEAASRRAADLERDVARLRSAEGNLIDLVAEGLIDKRQFAERVGGVRERLRDAQAELRRHRAESDSAGLAERLGELRAIVGLLQAGELAGPDLRAIVAIAVERIVVGSAPGRQVRIAWRPGADALFG